MQRLLASSAELSFIMCWLILLCSWPTGRTWDLAEWGKGGRAGVFPGPVSTLLSWGLCAERLTNVPRLRGLAGAGMLLMGAAGIAC